MQVDRIFVNYVANIEERKEKKYIYANRNKKYKSFVDEIFIRTTENHFLLEQTILLQERKKNSTWYRVA